jgi:hypothetical protein
VATKQHVSVSAENVSGLPVTTENRQLRDEVNLGLLRFLIANTLSNSVSADILLGERNESKSNSDRIEPNYNRVVLHHRIGSHDKVFSIQPF